MTGGERIKRCATALCVAVLASCSSKQAPDVKPTPARVASPPQIASDAGDARVALGEPANRLYVDPKSYDFARNPETLLGGPRIFQAWGSAPR